MTDLGEVVRRRRMTRSFTAEPVDPALIDDLVDLASRSPSAGKTQGWHLVVLEGAQTERFWAHTLPAEERAAFAWPGLLRAPVIALPVADREAYVERYRAPEKARTGLGAGPDAWPTPYWTVDASMAVMTLLLAAEDAGLGALFFAVFRGRDELLADLGVPDHLDLLGAVALGRPDPARTRAGVSASRRRRPPEEIIHRGRW